MRVLLLALLSLLSASHAATAIKATQVDIGDNRSGPLFVDGCSLDRSWNCDRLYIPNFNVHTPQWHISGDYVDIIPAVNGTGTIFAARAKSSHDQDNPPWSSYQSVQAIDFMTGGIIWETNITNPYFGSRPTSPALIGDVNQWDTARVVVGTSDGAIHLLNADTGAMLDNYTAPIATKATVTRVIGKDSTIFARTMKGLMRLEVTSSYNKLSVTFEIGIKDFPQGRTPDSYDQDLLGRDRDQDFYAARMAATENLDYVAVVTRNVTGPAVIGGQTVTVVTTLLRAYHGNGGELWWSPWDSGLRLHDPCIYSNGNILYASTTEGRAVAVNLTSGARLWGDQGIDLTQGQTAIINSGETCSIYTTSPGNYEVSFQLRYNWGWVAAVVSPAGTLSTASPGSSDATLFPRDGETWYQDMSQVNLNYPDYNPSKIILSGHTDTSTNLLGVMPTSNERIARRFNILGPNNVDFQSLWDLQGGNDADSMVAGYQIFAKNAPALGPWGSAIYAAEEQGQQSSDPRRLHALVYAGCPSNSVGLACERCLDNYFFLDGSCTACPSYGVGLYIAAILGFIVLVIILAKLGSAPALTPITQFVNFAQILGVLAVMNISWPLSVRNLLNWFSFLNFNVDAAGPECTPGLTFLKDWNIKYLIMMLIPVAFFLVLGLLALIAKAIKKPALIVGLKRASLMFCRLAFLPYVVKTLQYFDCTRHRNAAPSGGDLWTFDAYPSITCFSGDWFQWIATVIPGFIFCLGTLILIVRKTRRNAKGAYTEEFDKVYGSLYNRYHTRFRWWELTVLLRKGWIAVVGLMTATNPSTSGMLSLVILIMSAFATTIYRPFSTRRHQVLESVLVVGNMLQVIMAIVSNSLGSDAKDGTSAGTAIFVVMVIVLVIVIISVIFVVLQEVKEQRVKKKQGQKSGEPTEEMRPVSSVAPAGDDELTGNAISDEERLTHRRYTLRRRSSITLFSMIKTGKLDPTQAAIEPPGYTPFTAGTSLSRAPYRAAWIAMLFGIGSSSLVIAGWVIRNIGDKSTTATMSLVIAGVSICIIPLILMTWASMSIRAFIDDPRVCGLRKLRRLVYVVGLVLYGFGFFVAGKAGDNFNNDAASLNSHKYLSYAWAGCYFVACVFFMAEFLVVIRQTRNHWRDMVSTVNRLTVVTVDGDGKDGEGEEATEAQA